MSSAAFTLHVSPHAAPGDPEALERADLVRDGFSWWAFLFPTLWLFWHRHWLTGLAAAAAVIGLAAALFALGARTGTILAAEALLHALFGLEGASLRRFAYARRGRPVSDVVLASSVAEAEAKSFARWLEPRPSAIAPPEATPLRPRVSDREARVPQPIIGLFPDREGWR